MLRYPAPLAERRDLVRRMGAAIRHRGPDDEGWFADDDVTLGMQRLSVIDVAGGHQPMATEDGRLRIIFNGEIFNYRDVRDDLRRAGDVFTTQSDTEVILRQCQRHGLGGFDRLNGMFAVALWDSHARELHLVRDRMGVKPIYYYWDGAAFAFASEIKALFELPAVRREVEPRGVWDYLTFRYVPGPGTIWKHVYKLPPAHRLTMHANEGGPRVSRWWDIPAPGPVQAVDDKAMTAEFGRLFTDAVQRRMVADVPVGIMLSGGVDSSAVAAVAVQSHGRNLKTYSVSFADSPATDERPYARAVAQHLGTDHAEVEIGLREFVDFLPQLVRVTDEPLADLASVPLYYVSKLARQTVTVALSGEGADEILAGYDFDRWLAARAGAEPDPADVRRDAVPPHMTNYMDSAAKRALFREPADHPDSVDVLRGHLARGGARHPLDQMLFLYCQDWLVEDLLMKADKMSMANSLELRTPFLDYRLVEWAARAPLSAKVGVDADGHAQTKRVLRRFAEKLLPAEILTRPKRGFPVPVYDWLSGPLKGLAEDLVTSPGSALHAWFDSAHLRRLFDRGVANDAASHDRHRLWHLMVLALWLREWARR